MAIQKQVDLSNSGISASYWKVDSFKLDVSNSQVELFLSGFLDEAARLEGKASAPGAQYGMRLSKDVAEELKEAAYAAIAPILYREIKEYDLGGKQDPETGEYVPNKLFDNAKDC